MQIVAFILQAIQDWGFHDSEIVEFSAEFSLKCSSEELRGSALATVDHNIFAARKFRKTAPMYIFATQNFRECVGTSTKKTKKKKPILIMPKDAAVIIMRDLPWKRFR